MSVLSAPAPVDPNVGFLRLEVGETLDAGLAVDPGDSGVLARRSEPRHAGEVELRAAAGARHKVQGRLQKHRVHRKADGCPVAGGAVVEEIHHRQAAGARHVLHHHARVAGNIFADVRRKDARREIIGAARRNADIEAQDLALEE